MEKSQEQPQHQHVRKARDGRPQSYYDAIKKKFAEERDLRLHYRPEGTAQYTSDLGGPLARYEVDTFGAEVTPREPINDTVECLFIGGGFSALLTSARLRERGVESASHSGQRGDQIVTINVVVPHLQDERSKEIMRELAKLNNQDPRVTLFDQL